MPVDDAETTAATPPKRIKLFTTAFACTLASAFLIVFALGVIYHRGPPPPAATLPFEVKPVGADVSRRVRRRESAAMWAGDPKKEMMKKAYARKRQAVVRKKLEKNVMKQKTEMAGIPRTSHESDT